MKMLWGVSATAILLGVLGTGLANMPGPLVKTVPSPLAPLAEGEEVQLPTWLPADARPDGAVGRTNVLSLRAQWLFPPVAGKPSVVSLTYSNLTGHAYICERPMGDYRDRRGVLCLAVATDGSRHAVDGFPECAGVISTGIHWEVGETHRLCVRLPASTVNDAAGSTGLTFAYVDYERQYVFWAESAPLPVPPTPSNDPPALGETQWLAIRSYMVEHGTGLPYVGVRGLLEDYPELAPFFPGVVLDTSLPEAFRLEFAERMPELELYDPAVYTFMTNAPDKSLPVVVAALRVFRKMRPENDPDAETRYQAHLQLQTLVDNPAVATVFREELLRGYLYGMGRNLMQEMGMRTDPNIRLLLVQMALSEHGNGQGAYTADHRAALRQALVDLNTSTVPYVPDGWPPLSPVEGVTTVGAAALGMIDRFDTQWPE